MSCVRLLIFSTIDLSASLGRCKSAWVRRVLRLCLPKLDGIDCCRGVECVNHEVLNSSNNSFFKSTAGFFDLLVSCAGLRQTIPFGRWAQTGIAANRKN